VSLSLVHKPPHTCYALLIKTYARLPQVYLKKPKSSRHCRNNAEDETQVFI
jgi:hypothetical protein